MKVERKILEFGRLLRKYGMKVSITQIEDALKAVAEMGLERDKFYHALRCVMVTERAELDLFDNLFNFFFSSSYPHQRNPEDTGNSLPDSPEKNRCFEREVTGILDEQDAGRKGEKQVIKATGKIPAGILVRAVQEGDYAVLRYLAEQGVKNLGRLSKSDYKNMDFLIEKAKENISWNEAVKQLLPKV